MFNEKQLFYILAYKATLYCEKKNPKLSFDFHERGHTNKQINKNVQCFKKKKQ